MSARGARVYWLIGGILTGLLVGHGVRRIQRPPADALDGVPGLETPITLSETRISLGELVQKVSGETGATLSASREVADEPVAVVVTEYPARELLRQTAALLDFTWRRKESGPEIGQDAAARQRAAAQRAAVIGAARERLQHEIRRIVTLASAPGALADGETEPQLADSPVARLLARFLGTLSLAHWNRAIEEGRSLVFSTDPAPGEMRLAPDMARSLREAVPRFFPGGPVTGSDADLGRLRQREQERQEAWAKASGYRVTLRTNIEALRQGAERLRLTLHAAPIDGASSEWSPEAGSGGDTSLRIEVAAPEMAPAGTARCPRLSELLPALARAHNVQILADAYHRSPRLRGDPFAAEEGLEAWLARYAAATHRWDRQGKLLRLRSRSWAFDRPREVPGRLLRRWQKQCDEQGALPLDEWVLAISGLNEGQLQTLAEVARERGWPPELQTARAAWPCLRLYASLPPDQQQALARGEEIPASAMGPRQRELFRAVIADGAPGLSAVSGDGGGFSLSRAALTRPRKQTGKPQGHRVTQITLHCRIGPGVSRCATLVAGS